MTRRQGPLVVVLLLAALTTRVSAEPTTGGVDLRLRPHPMPRTLRMRPRPTQTAQSLPPTAPVRPTPLPPGRGSIGLPPQRPIAMPPSALPVAASSTDDLGGVRDVRQPVSFTVNIGYQVEATALSDAALTINGQPATLGRQGPSFTKLRSYGFGEGFLSTRGVGVSTLSTYFSLRFQAARDLETTDDPQAGRVMKPPPIATWFERSGAELRTGWVEAKDFFKDIKGVRVRAGNQFIYGPWIMHVNGVLAAWETKLIKFQGYIGARHADYSRDLTEDRATIIGGSARIDLRDLTDPIPFALALDALDVGADLSADTPGSRTLLLEADWRPKQDFALIAKVRQLDGRITNERLEFRGRYKQVSNLVIDVIHRRGDDWRWDPSQGRLDPNDDVMTARRYLDLGPTVPQLVGSIRGGTLIAENLDISLRGAIARDISSQENINAYSASYLEGAAAVQARLRRQLALDLSVLTRQNSLAEPVRISDLTGIPYDPLDPATCGMAATPGAPTACQVLPSAPTVGELGFTEIGAALRMTLGARRFSAAVELFGRQTRYQTLYDNAADAEEGYDSDVRGGGRFTIDAWIGNRLRLYAAYDLSSRFEFSPEVTGYKSLRLSVSGTY